MTPVALQDLQLHRWSSETRDICCFIQQTPTPTEESLSPRDLYQIYFYNYESSMTYSV